MNTQGLASGTSQAPNPSRRNPLKPTPQPGEFGSLRLLLATLLAIWLVLPLVPLALWSFASGWFFPDLLPENWSLKAWRYAFSTTAGVLGSLVLSLSVSAAATLIALVVGIPAGRALGLYRFKARPLVEVLVLFPLIVPGIAVVLGLQGIFIKLGLTNTATGVVIAHLIPTLPYVILVMASVFANYDTRIEEQARTLGANAWQCFFYVTVPTLMPGIVACALFAFLVSWSQYILTLVIGGGRVVTLPLLLFNFASSGRNDITGAIGIMYLLPGILTLVLSARWISGRHRSLTGVHPPL